MAPVEVFSASRANRREAKKPTAQLPWDGTEATTDSCSKTEVLNLFQ